MAYDIHHEVEEIHYEDIEKLEIVGKGSFGTVYKARWKGKLVALKHIDNEAERKTFTSEVRQLSRVNHPNIIKLYGACTRDPVCLVMEYAEGGSLHKVLHGRPSPRYNIGHAISWCLQCAEGVAYLHNMKPKALVHRDLKPPNLLLGMGGTVLKICDFGTACDLKTYMTNNKGSAAWMAPEVFESCVYTEKCDVFSWGIILWQVLTRQKPFDEIRNAWSIMWGIHQGKRPPLIEGCPKPLERLMIRCWEKDAGSRPSMNEIVNVISKIFRFFPGHDKPLVYDTETSYESEPEEMQTEEGSFSDIPDSSIDSQQNMNGSISGTTGSSDPQFSKPLQIAITDENESYARNYVELPNDALSINIPAANQLPRSNINGKMNSSNFADGGGNNVQEEIDDNVYLMLDPQLMPLDPDRSCEKSVELFDVHKNKAKEYLKIQTELAYTTQRKQELQEELSRYESLSTNSGEHEEEKRKLEEEKKSLLAFYNTLKQQEETMNKPQKADWVFVQSSSDHPP